ncbi:MAG: hypothetical protein MR034_00970 [Actinobacillus porcinus]|nr:hypothetical protein [Actinobacillus porcinus]
MRMFVLILSTMLFSGCAIFETKHSKAVENALAKPSTPTEFAYIRIFPTINERGKNNYLGVEIIENGKLKFVGFKWYGNKSISLGMPHSTYYKFALKNNELFGEYIIPANLPVIVGYVNSKSCSSAWIFPTCFIHRYERYFIPEANKNYDIINEYHVYEIDKFGNKKKIDSTGEIINSWKTIK